MSSIARAAQQAAADAKVGQFLETAFAVFKSPDPATSFAWLASVETDDDLKFAFSHAAELVRARGGSRD